MRDTSWKRSRSKVGVLYQNDDFGKAYLAGFKQGLGDRAPKMIVLAASYESTDTTVDSQIVTLKASGADVLFTAAIPKMAAQTIRKVYEIGWKPLHVMFFGGRSIPTVLKPVGLEKSVGLISAVWDMTPGDPRWEKDPGIPRLHEAVLYCRRPERRAQFHGLFVGLYPWPCTGAMRR